MMKSRKYIQTQSKVVLAIDPGFDRVGVAILKHGELLFSDCIVTNRKDSQAKRLLTIKIAVEKIIKKWKPEALAIEKLFFNQNTTNALSVAEARGVIIAICAENNLEIFEYSPQAIKIAVTGYGKADKTQVLNMVKKLCKLEDKISKRLDDEVDAIALGITHLATKNSF